MQTEQAVQNSSVEQENNAIVRFVSQNMADPTKVVAAIEEYKAWYDSGFYYTKSRQAVRAAVEVVGTVLTRLVELEAKVHRLEFELHGPSKVDHLAPPVRRGMVKKSMKKSPKKKTRKSSWIK
jgi:hypothetical protein